MKFNAAYMLKKCSILAVKLLLAVLACMQTNVTATARKYVGKPFFQNYNSLEYKGHNRNFDLECDNTGRVFVANFEGLLIYDGATWEMMHTPGISRITNIFIAKNKQIWFGGNNVLGYINPSKDIKAEYIVNDADKTIRFDEVSAIYEKQGHIYFTRGDRMEYVVNDNDIKKTSIKPAGDKRFWQNAEITDEEDIRDMNLTAISTLGLGVIILDKHGQQVYSLSADDGLCSSNVNALSYDGKGTIWGATDNGIFKICLSNVFTHYSESDGLVGQVTSILKNGNNLYVGTLQGLFLLDDNDHFKKVDGTDLACWQLMRSHDGKTLAATAEGLFQYGNLFAKLSDSHTLSIIEDEHNVLISGEIDGIYRYTVSGKRLIAKIPNVIKFHRDKSGDIWAITLSRETYCKKSGSNKFIATENNDNISLLFDYYDSDGRVWHPYKNNMGLACNQLDDIQSKWCMALNGYSIQAMELQNEVAWIGGNFGLIRMNMTNMKRLTPYKSSLYIRQYQKDGSQVYFAFSNDKEEPIGQTLYSYRLHSSSKWSKWTDESDITFAHLTPGSYEFMARTADPYGNIVTSEAIQFEIPWPFYLKWYAWIVYILIFAFLIYCFMKWRMHRAERERIMLEKTVNERTQELREAQSQLIRQEREATVGKLTKGLIDRILNPMNYINNFSHLSLGLIKDLNENIADEEKNMSQDNFEDSMDVLDMMKTNLEKIEQHGISTTRILKAMEELLKDQHGKIEPVNIVVLCQQSIDMTKKYYDEDIKRFGINIEWENPSTPISADLVLDHLRKTLMSMLANSMYAVKKKIQKDIEGYTPIIRMRIRELKDEKPEIVIYDNGVGIEDNIKDKIFDPFFTTKSTSEASGVGLYLCQQAVQNFGGKIKMNSVKDEFTEFVISLP